MVMRDRLLRAIDLGDGQALDVVAAPGKQPDDARQHARLVVDQHGDRVALDVGIVSQSSRSSRPRRRSALVRVSTSTMPSSETGLCRLLSVGAEQHLVMRRARGDHREAVLRLVDRDIERSPRPAIVEHLARSRRRARPGSRRAQPDGAERLGQLDEIGQRRGVALGIAAAMQQFLPLAHHAHVLVVEDEHLHRQPVLARRSTSPGCSSGSTPRRRCR